MNINTSALEKLGLQVPEILLPREDIPQDKWAVIACDQHTSDPEYWKRVEEYRGKSPSTLDLVYPEVYLEDDRGDERISDIHSAMKRYLDEGVLKSKGRGWVYVQRHTEASGLREGLVLAVDLEKYDYSADSTSPIRATEGTILDRLPPRIKIRKQAPLELPHIMILIDDRSASIIEGLKERTDDLECIYDTPLMLDGGHLSGYWIDQPHIINDILSRLEPLGERETSRRLYGSDNPLPFAMGDGNHSLATAKAVWEALKKEHLENGGSFQDIEDHPSRYALAELVNIYSPGLRFEPIHRCLFHTDAEAYFQALESETGSATVRLDSEKEAKEILQAHQNDAVAYHDGNWYHVSNPLSELAPAVADRAFHTIEDRLEGGKIDFIHGWDHSKSICEASPDRIAVFFNVIPREELFSYVVQHGALPRKAFSMGDAEEKRYYYEVRRVRN
ncbi:DUF1015 domain-containing protein [Salinispira pacifica]|uniref:DUF1015 domain-containing protein n=1 Tax=Salinispira pacifica TaxID=1307761 RepID=V5WHL6_9SPIO|nr:DUF1015 domain-containing protein [Salinispira pacifica]AHC15014.1 hypothetical protein L21SP2_1629 [Salinispira pacifica]